MPDFFDLYDYRVHNASLYRERARAVLAGEDAIETWQRFRAGRDELFAAHPQSALDEEQRGQFRALSYFPYNPAMCVIARVDTNIEAATFTVAMNAQEPMTMTRAARLHFEVEGQAASLSVYWLNVYGGGLFLPFRDATCPAESYGGGRYLFDTIKGSDFLPVSDLASKERILLDFNYAYNPSCAYNSKWVCPLSPPENRLRVAIRAGEKNFSLEGEGA
ncbi:MAG TPA: DUF1684 domain-containing protein [Ktedonobacteraceae bacterium]|nr:DUF1684 domain-containing protein [Ktedonobacteraceae bacterium]